MTDKRILLIGYGNPGRLDDGLGPAAAEAIEQADLPSVTVDSDYQLTVEDAETASRHEVVIFVDAAETGPEPFSVAEVEPVAEVSFSTHSVRPEAVVAMVENLFNSSTTGYVVGIRGYEFNEFAERLSEPARANLAATVEFLTDLLVSADPAEIRKALDKRSAAAAPAKGVNRCRTEST